MPFIIWAATRTSSTNLCLALDAENEPFQAGPPASRLRWAYEQWLEAGKYPSFEDMGLTNFKHIPEDINDWFNISIAIAATKRGYRHVHIVRRDELARLVSLDVAGQLNAWWPHDAKDRFAELRKGERKLNPLDVPRLVENSQRVAEAWDMVEPHLGPTMMVLHEHLTSRNQAIRHATLLDLIDFLEIPYGKIVKLEAAMRHGGQHSEQIWDLVPNINELREALA